MTVARPFCAALLVAIVSLTTNAQEPVSSAITYQGELRDNTDLANGLYDLEFYLYDAVQSGMTVATEVVLDNVPVVDGIFSVSLDFGDQPFDGSALWLEIRVRRDGTTGTTILEPRQPLTPTPYAIQALMVNADAIGSANIVNNSVSAADIATNAVTASEIAANAVGQDEIADGAVNANALSLPLYLTGNNSGGAELVQGGVLTAINTSPSTPSDTWSPYGIVGSVEYSSGTPSPLYLPPAGVLGQADSTGGTGIGVIGLSGEYDGLGWPSRAGVYGLSRDARGVSGLSINNVGVRGVSTNTRGGDFVGDTGLSARGQGANRYGAEFYSNEYRGMFAQGEDGFFDGYFGTGQGISASNVIDRGGAAKVLAINLGDQPIERGDLVSLAGVATNPENGQPLLGVALLNETNAKGVVGVSNSAIRLTKRKRETGGPEFDFAPSDGATDPQGYLVVITSGLAPEVKLTALPKTERLEVGQSVSIDLIGQLKTNLPSNGYIQIGRVAGSINSNSLMVPIYIDID